MERKFKKESSYDDKNPNKFRKESKKVCAFCAEKGDGIDYKTLQNSESIWQKKVKSFQEEQLVFVQDIKENLQVLSREQELWLFYHIELCNIIPSKFFAWIFLCLFLKTYGFFD